MMRTILGAALLVLLTACGGGHNPDKDGNVPYRELSDGRRVMAESITAVATGANFEVSFDLEEGGSVTLYTFANSDLHNGVSIQFARVQNSLKVFATAQGIVQDWSPRFESVDASQTVPMTIDIHNNERPAHIMIWSGSKNSSLNHRNTLYNSAEDSLDLNYDNSPGNGFGRSWGIKLDKAQLHKATLSSPQDAH
ncbi:hypothetical protein [Bdellovibrio bacteriovorus]|uniref:hypothetical protein n=1 Tax=Bdellovibrio TaxID=958 RepID=UPI0035A94014